MEKKRVTYRDDDPIVTRKAGDTEVWVGGCMRSKGLEYCEYLYVQRETREEVGGGRANEGCGGHQERGALHEPIRETAVGYGGIRGAGGGSFMERFGAERVSTTSDPRFLRARP